MSLDPSVPVADPSRPRRVVLAGVGRPDRGAGDDEVEEALVRRARTLRDAGVEVIWAGSGLRAEQVAAIVVAEDADGAEVAPDEAAADVIEALVRLEVEDVEVVAASR